MAAINESKGTAVRTAIVAINCNSILGQREARQGEGGDAGGF